MAVGFLTILSGYAERSFKITDYQAQAKILENGDIQVSEIFEYDFNGIIRDKQRTRDSSLFFNCPRFLFLIINYGRCI